MRRQFALIGIVLLVLSGLWSFFSLVQEAGAAPVATITVDSAGDDSDASGGTGTCATATGDCTLRAAIETAQAQAGTDTIIFNADLVISLTGSLPTLVETDLTIDGAGHTVQVNGDGIAGNVFQINGQGIAIKNLRVYGAGSTWANIWIQDDALAIEIANNLIGDDDPAPGGCGNSDDSFGGVFVSALNPAGEQITAWIYGNTIECHTTLGGDGITIFGSKAVFVGIDPDENDGPAQRNVIRDNGEGIVVVGSESSSILNNHILENTSGLRIIDSGLISVWDNIIENNADHGVEIIGGTAVNFVGCNIFEDNEAAARNYIRGNAADGVHISGASSENKYISCNWIGLADDGRTAAPNDTGIYITDDAENTWVISNTLSGNTLDGLRIVSSGGDHLILSNTIGLDPTGVYSLSNNQHGIGIVDDVGDNLIGGNLIGSNSNFGVYISNSPDTALDENYIGVAEDGLTPRGNGFDGVYVMNSMDTQFGSFFTPRPQIIAHNGDSGIYLDNAGQTQILTTTYVLNNQSNGIYLYQTIGSYVAPQRVSGNGSAGVWVVGDSATDNFLLPQQVYNNGGLPVELGVDGLEPNDPGDADPGPNGYLNYPEVTSTSGSVVTGTATMGVYAVAVYEVLGDPTQPGGGGIFRGAALADASGNWSIDLDTLGLAHKPVAFIAHSGTPGFFTGTSSPLSPVTQLGYSLHLPVIQRD